MVWWTSIRKDSKKEEVRLAQVKERVAEHEKPSFRQGAAS
jgi:hypothetical protein